MAICVDQPSNFRILLNAMRLERSAVQGSVSGFASFTEKISGLDGIFSSDSRIGSEKSERIA